MARTPVVALGFTIPVPMSDNIAKLQKKLSKGVSEIVREAISEYCERRKALLKD